MGMIKKSMNVLCIFSIRNTFSTFIVFLYGLLAYIRLDVHFVVMQKTYKDMYNYILSITNGKCLYIHSVSVCWIYIHKSRLSPPYILLYSYKCAALTCPLGGQISICLHCPLCYPD